MVGYVLVGMGYKQQQQQQVVMMVHLTWGLRSYHPHSHWKKCWRQQQQQQRTREQQKQE